MTTSPEQLAGRLLRVEQNMATKADVDAIRKDIAGLVEAWDTATGVLKFVKWFATFIAAVGSVWIVWKQL